MPDQNTPLQAEEAAETATGPLPIPLPLPLPAVRLKAVAHKRLARGHPWAFSNEIALDEATRALVPGSVVRLLADSGQDLGTALFNRHTLIAARLISRKAEAALDLDFFCRRLERALAIREKLYDAPYYRLCHAEADGLPGTVIDRYGAALTVQVNIAGMEGLLPPLLDAIDRVLAPEVVVLRNDSPSRELEGLTRHVEVVKGRLEGPHELVENGARYWADLEAGQKTGWFYDQRDNRALVGRLAKGARVLDGYAYSGGFAIQAALGGAREVVAVERSEAALDLARQAAEANGVAARCQFTKAEVFAELGRLARAGERFDLVVIDPPAFVKLKRELPQGLKGYRKLARLAALAVAPGGTLVAASCSYHVDAGLFAEQLRRGVHDAGREGRVLYQRGAGPDHPVHPFLPETAYLKLQVIALD